MRKKFQKSNARGLKALSLRVRDIVCEKKQTTYKDVADILIAETRSKSPASKKLTVSQVCILSSPPFPRKLRILLKSFFLTFSG